MDPRPRIRLNRIGRTGTQAQIRPMLISAILLTCQCSVLVDRCSELLYAPPEINTCEHVRRVGTLSMESYINQPNDTADASDSSCAEKDCNSEFRLARNLQLQRKRYGEQEYNEVANNTDNGVC